jgi:hypothetical protein
MLAQFLWEAGGFLQPWQHMAIDISIFICVTMPPRHYWQSAIAGLVMAQIWLHAIWWLSPDLARTHWLGGTILEFAKCAVLLLWSGGARVETVLHSAARFVADMVPVSLSAKPAR